jgi:hypothetical protein
MRYALVLWAGCLVGCDQPHGEGLARESLRHEAQRDQCIASEKTACTPAEAYLGRFFDGKGGPKEFAALEQLPPIPPTFDAPLEAYLGQSRGLLSRPRAAHE